MPEDDQWGARATRDRMHDRLCSTCRIKGGKPACTAHTARRSHPAPNKPPVVPSPLSLAPSRDPDRHTDAIRDEVRFAANRRDPDAAVREVLDTALPEVRSLAVTVERRAQVEQDGRPPHGQWDEEPAATGDREHNIVVIRGVEDVVVVVVAAHGRMSEEITEPGAGVEIRTQRAGRHGDLRANAAEHDIVAGVDVERNAARHEAHTGALIPVLQEPALRANAEDAIAIEVPDEAAGDTVAFADEVVEVTERPSAGEVAVAVAARQVGVGPLSGAGLRRECGCAKGCEGSDGTQSVEDASRAYHGTLKVESPRETRPVKCSRLYISAYRTFHGANRDRRHLIYSSTTKKVPELGNQLNLSRARLVTFDRCLARQAGSEPCPPDLACYGNRPPARS